MFTIEDDDGFVGIIDPDAYETFVDKNWTLHSLFAHFAQQMSRQALLLWGTSEHGGSWKITLNQQTSGFRSPELRTVTGPLISTAGRLCLVSYADLTMAAQFTDFTLPEKHAADLAWSVTPGPYSCTVTQLRDLEQEHPRDQADFNLTISHSALNIPAWTRPAWRDPTSGE